MKINWKKGLFSSKYELFSQNKKIGELNEEMFSRTAIGKLNNSRVKFRKKGVFSSETEITDLNLNSNIGQIKFNAWGNKAEINLNGKKLGWKSDSFWGKKWSVLENGQPIVKYDSSTFKGEIDSKINDEVLLLAGLFVFNYYMQMIIIIATSTAIIVSAN